ncbi:MAG: hypothetical protein K8T91_16640 [Planctomycetes bacterium]|nr:hypothetical protein [Planctomycetota bacterium]
MSYSGYSSKVDLSLIIGDKELSLSHVGRSGVIVCEPCEPIPPCDAKIVVKIDDAVSIKNVFLPQGIAGQGISAVFI